MQGFLPNKVLYGSPVEVYRNGELVATGTLNSIRNQWDWEVDGVIYSLSDSTDAEIVGDTVKLYTIG